MLMYLHIWVECVHRQDCKNTTLILTSNQCIYVDRSCIQSVSENLESVKFVNFSGTFTPVWIQISPPNPALDAVSFENFVLIEFVID